MSALKYLIQKDLRLVIRYFEGKITISDLYKSVSVSASDTIYDSSFSAIYDLRNAEFDTNYEEINSIADKVRNNKEILNKRKLALLTDSPNQVVFALLMENISKTGLIDMKIFSTLEACLFYLGVNMKHLESIDENLNELREKS